MCRWLAYQGSPIYLDSLLFNPEHSLIEQSRHAEQSVYETNGDGFGVGWYGLRDMPGIYRDTRPAWNDKNLRNLAEQVKSPLFLSHIRATTGTAIQRSNCHPFSHKNWLFQHNGEINDFDRMKQQLDALIAPELYPFMEGSTDSERLFFLALTYGLENDVHQALRRMVGRIEALRVQHNIEAPFKITAALSDGSKIMAIRYSSDRDSHTLFHSRNSRALEEVINLEPGQDPEGVLVLSEPLDKVSRHWQEVPEATFLRAEQGEVILESFEPES